MILSVEKTCLLGYSEHNILSKISFFYVLLFSRRSTEYSSTTCNMLHM